MVDRMFEKCNRLFHRVANKNYPVKIHLSIDEVKPLIKESLIMKEVMKEKQIKIGAFASSISLAECIRRITEEQHYQITISQEGLDTAIPVGKKMERSGIEVIISRRGTAHLLRENLRIPVLALPQTSLNFMMTLKKAVAVGKKILLPSFRNRMSHLEILEEMLGIELIQGVYNDSHSLEQVVIAGVQKRSDVVVGGNVTMRFARKHGLPFVEFVTAEEDIIETIENAKSVARSNRQERAITQRYQSIINAASEGILSVDEKGVITTINKAAQLLMKMSHNNVMGKQIRDVLPKVAVFSSPDLKKPIYNNVEKVNDNLCVFNQLPVMLGKDLIGAVYTFKDASHIMKAENKVRRTLSKGLVAKYIIEDLVHESPAMQNIVHLAKQYAKTDSTLLIVGATGTGKEVVSQSIHNLSKREKEPFVSVNCSALPEQLLESELFGYEEGAFTGSKKGGKPGRFEIAHRGTIFLDEIDTTPENVQVRLLRILQEREVMRLGGDRKIPIDVRVIAAASQDLAVAVQQGRLREDLFFRLNVLRIFIPPLRERRQDVPVLLKHFVKRIAKKYNMAPVELSNAYVRNLMAYNWPGNVRQLRNFSERIVLNCNLECGSGMLDELYTELVKYPLKNQIDLSTNHNLSLQEELGLKKIENEGQIILKALEAARFCKSRAAQELGISRTTLWRKMKAAGLE